MTAADIADIQARLETRLPDSYVELMLSGWPRLKSVFYERAKILDANLKVRRKCWRGDPLDQIFYVFGQYEDGRVLFLDTDISGGAVFLQDESSTDPSVRGRLLNLSFEQWLDTGEV